MSRYRDPVEDTFNEIMGGCAVFFALLFVGIGIGIGYWIWG